MPQERKGYVVNLATKKLHRTPTREQCNMDQSESKTSTATRPPKTEYRSECRYCFPNKNPGGASE